MPDFKVLAGDFPIGKWSVSKRDGTAISIVKPEEINNPHLKLYYQVEDVVPGEVFLSYVEASGSHVAKFVIINLEKEATEIEVVNEQNAKSIAGMAGAAAIGAVLLGPLGVLGGALIGGNRKVIHFAVCLRDGKRVIGEIGNKDWLEYFVPISLSIRPQPHTRETTNVRVGSEKTIHQCQAPDCANQLGDFKNICAAHVEQYLDHRNITDSNERRKARDSFRNL